MKKLFLILAVVAMSFGTAVAQNGANNPGSAKDGEQKESLLTEVELKMAAEFHALKLAAGENKAQLDAVEKTIEDYITTTFATPKNAKKEKKAEAQAKADAFKAHLAELAKPQPEPEPEVVNENIEGETVHNKLMEKFLEGGWIFMLPILLALVLGMAIAIERILYLSLSTINTKSFIAKVELALQEGGIEAAKELCRRTRGPIASIFYQGLDRYHQGLDAVEKSVVSYGSVQTGKMESGLSWLSLAISLAPSLGFLGTVVGLVQAFEDIETAGNISPDIVAGGMKLALLTTLFGLIAAMVLQVLYNFVIAKIDGMVNDMEDASISLTDMLTAYSNKK
jgi:biopolymer transport protein ExbB